MKTTVTILVRIERIDRRGRRTVVWERGVSEDGGFPGHLAQQELFTVAHAQIHPRRPTPPHLHD